MAGIVGRLLGRLFDRSRPTVQTIWGGSGSDPLDAVQTAIGYRFEDSDLLRLAMLHRSHAAEIDSEKSYERLEFLGDAVLQLAITRYLYETYPELAEGEMAKVRAAVVDATTLADLGRSFGLGAAMLLGRGEELTGGRDKDSILADVVEALLGAVYLESGYETAHQLIIGHWQDRVDRRSAAPGRRDYKNPAPRETCGRGKETSLRHSCDGAGSRQGIHGRGLGGRHSHRERRGNVEEAGRAGSCQGCRRPRRPRKCLSFPR